MKTILIVDDSETFQKIIEKILSPNFQIVGKGKSGIEGFDLYKQLSPDIVLMDITMPNCDGKECLQKILVFDSLAKVIMVSGIGDEKTVQECLDLGAKAFVNKSDISRKVLENSPLEQTVFKIAGIDQQKKVA